MDPTSFDDLVRSLHRPTSRRLLAGLLGAALAGSLGGAADAKSKRQHHKRRVKAQKGGNANGNSQNAKRCQKGGWATLAPSENPATPFANEEECVSYGAKGGTIVDACRGLSTPCNPTTDTCCQETGSVTVCAFENQCFSPRGDVPEGDVCCRQAGQPCVDGCACCGNLFCNGGVCG
jgi:hypothetical protein